MERYVQQLLIDIAHATANVAWPYQDKERSVHDWISDEEEDRTAPRRPLEEWTGIRKAQLPPADQLTDDQVHRLLEALKTMLVAYNWSFVIQIKVPERIQYATLRANFDQEAKVKQWHMGFFEMCRPGTPHGTCALGEYCHCRFYEEFWGNCVDEELTPAEERARALDWEITRLKDRYGDEWEEYYPYHLDPKYDDADGNPYDYGFAPEKEDDPADWWRKGS